ncbi:Y-family DNA polymerase [Acidicapsa ligni]|uniref:Y-family DNA polymerase n=1 Tax=Acidicapsa ligni TaxID=542300 RepID=UPI0021DFE275|nr:DNA polymerase [Acidicapsa ligni]
MMADSSINWLFVDLNSYFASIEQELRPELRGQPVGIVPVDVDSTCCIAASYQAKAYGIKTGTGVADAKALCPHLIVVEARPRLYVEYHHRIAAAIERCIPIQQVMSCDEFACQLIGRERTLQRATAIAYEIKHELRTVGITLRCSVGLAPNRLLAKIAGDMQKPDGLMIFEHRYLPQSLYSLQLGDIPGIGKRMEERLHTEGVNTMRQLCALTRERMHTIWGGVLGDRLWLWLRGEDFLEPPARPLQTLSRQHILPPDCRTLDKARAVALKLLHSTARKMRRNDLWAGGISLQVGFREHPTFACNIRIEPCHDPYTLQEHLIAIWPRVPAYIPSDLSVALTHLDGAPSPDLFGIDPFQQESARERVMTALDSLNARYGLNTIYLGSIHEVRKEAPTRIPFGPPPPLEEFDDTADKLRTPRGPRGIRASDLGETPAKRSSSG